jgi:hypothetical protein
VKYNFEKVEEVTIEIFDIRGVLLQTIKDTDSYKEKELKINLDFLRKTNQVYFVRVSSDNGSEVKKIVSARN